MSEEAGRAREAALKAGDPDRLLPGEDPGSTHLDDARHWIEVYGELLEYKDRLLAVTDEMLGQRPEESAGREIAETDRALIVAERSRFVRRLDYWNGRLDELRRST